MEENREVKREKVRSIPIEQIEDFPKHPFKIQDDEQMQKLIESIQNYGVITPVVARKIGEERYELISGHRRKYVCKMLEIDRLPVIVRDMSRDEAVKATLAILKETTAIIIAGGWIAVLIILFVSVAGVVIAFLFGELDVTV